MNPESERALAEVQQIFEAWKTPLVLLLRKAQMPDHTKRVVLPMLAWYLTANSFGNLLRNRMEQIGDEPPAADQLTPIVATPVDKTTPDEPAHPDGPANQE